MCDAFRAAFGGAVRARRLECGLSQKELGERSGVHRTYLAAVERGERNVTLANLVRIAGALETPLSEPFARAERLMDRHGGLT